MYKGLWSKSTTSASDGKKGWGREGGVTARGDAVHS